MAARDGRIASGLVGAGTGATVAGPGPVSAGRDATARRPGGLVTGAARVGDLVVAALVAVNAAGVPAAPDETALDLAAAAAARGDVTTGFGNTTIGLVATNARLDKMACHLVAQGAHDGLARAVFPAHTRADGDAFVAAAVGGECAVPAAVDTVRNLAVHVVALAIADLDPERPPQGEGAGGR